MSAYSPDAELVGMSTLSLALIGPDDQRRKRLASALGGSQANVARELTKYPEVDDIAEILEAHHDAVIIDMDPDPERALDVIENFCEASSGITVIVHADLPSHDLLLRCMRAGAREVLTEPLSASAVAEALVRVSARRDETRPAKKKALGKLFVFTGSKGGSGVTTIATNFAVSLARHCGGKAGLLDLEMELGDAALTLGLTPKFSVVDGLQEAARIDGDFFTALLTHHSSGVAVLAAPDEISSVNAPRGAVMKLVGLAREQFPYVVVDAGSRPGELLDALFDAANIVYLVAQVSVADLRNANRLIRRYFAGAAAGTPQIVLNRFQTRGLEIDEAAITKALGRPVNWKIPNDYAAARKAQNTGVAIASQDNQLSRVFADMAHRASGVGLPESKRKKFGLF